MTSAVESATRSEVDKLLARIDDDGVLVLTMADMNYHVTYKTANLSDIRCSPIPGWTARTVRLKDKGKSRLLKKPNGITVEEWRVEHGRNKPTGFHVTVQGIGLTPEAAAAVSWAVDFAVSSLMDGPQDDSNRRYLPRLMDVQRLRDMTKA